MNPIEAMYCLKERYVKITFKRGSSYEFVGDLIKYRVTILKGKNKIHKIEVIDDKKVVLKTYAKNVASIEEGYK